MGGASRRAGRVSSARARGRTGKLSAHHVRRSRQFVPRESDALPRGREHGLFRVRELRERRGGHDVRDRAAGRDAALSSAVRPGRLARRGPGPQRRHGTAGVAVPDAVGIEMSAASHLAVSPAGYDRRIRQYLPHYDELIAETARALRYALRRIRLIVDLGVGTAALSRACLDAIPSARVYGIDEDAAMLAVA